jgi:4-amino-4-deoxy-L-arabinose transferase-like glycosyltransferase
LVLGYNGLDRLLGVVFGSEGGRPAGTLGGPGVGAEQIGEPGPFRLLDQHNARQIGWLLPLAVVGLLAASWQRRLRLSLDRRYQALVLWGTWFLTAAAYFSAAGGGHRYYTVMLAPAVAALVGAGVMALWSDYRSSGPEGWFLPLALVLMAVLHVRMLAGYEDWSSRLMPMIVGLCLTAAAVLVVLRLRPKPKVGAYAAVATAVGVLALLIAPTVWASYQVFQGPRGPLPTAGPPPSQALADKLGGVNTQGASGINPPDDGQTPFGVSNLGVSPVGASGNAADPALIDYLQANQGNAEYLVAATDATSTAPIILSTDEPVISLGGYSGVDPVFTTKQLTDLVNKGAVRFFLVPDRERMTQMMSGDGASSQQSGQQSALLQNRSAKWVQHNCERVPRKLWQSSSFLDQREEGPGTTRPQALYDCGTGRR